MTCDSYFYGTDFSGAMVAIMLELTLYYSIMAFALAVRYVSLNQPKPVAAQNMGYGQQTYQQAPQPPQYQPKPAATWNQIPPPSQEIKQEQQPKTSQTENSEKNDEKVNDDK